MNKIIKLNLVKCLENKKILIILLFFMSVFLSVTYLNDYNTNYLFIQMMGVSVGNASVIEISIFLIFNAIIIYFTLDLLLFGSNSSQILLRVKKYNKWFISKWISLLIINGFILFLGIIIYIIISFIITKNIIIISFDYLVISYFKNILIEFLVSIFYLNLGEKRWK